MIRYWQTMTIKFNSSVAVQDGVREVKDGVQGVLSTNRKLSGFGGGT